MTTLQTKRRRKKVGVVAATAVTAIGAFADPASAHYVYRKDFVYASNLNCTGGRAEVSHGSGGGYSKADVYSWVRFSTVIAGDWDCYSDWSRPPGYLAVKYEYFKWNPNTGQADLCLYTNWYYNSSSTHQYAIYTDHGSKAPCGAGQYNTRTHAYVYNNGWYGGWIDSGWHTF